MGFTQVSFLFFFMPVSILLYLCAYRLSGKNLRICNGILVLEGLVFYWWAEPKLLLFFVVLTVLLAGLSSRMHNAGTKKEKRQMMVLSVIIFVLLPVVYKYIPDVRFPLGEGRYGSLALFSDVMVPLGLGFFVLGAISYIVDIYRSEAPAGTLMDTFEFMLLFPKAVCGPAVLWRDFSPQIYNREMSLDKVNNGVKKIIIGYAKKAIIADTFAAQIILIDSKIVSGGTDMLSAWILVLLYFFRIYYDFSGYSDIAIGLLKIFGFEIYENFDQPYLSESLADFWRRWHISLGRWFREYIYIPLGGSRKGNTSINIMITFLLAGLWHGWKLPLLLWGLLNGGIVAAERAGFRKEKKKGQPKYIRIAVTMLIVCFGWMLFRAPDMAAVGVLLKALIIPAIGRIPNFTWRFFLTKRIALFMVIAAAGTFGVFNKVNELLKSVMNESIYGILEKVILLVLFAISIMFMLGTDYVPFIYALI